MIITTTPAIEGKKIVEYKGIVLGECGVVVDNIQYYTHTRLVHRLNEGFKLADARLGGRCVGRVGTLGSRIVLRLVAPIILIRRHRLVDRAKVGGGEQVDVCYAHLDKVVEARCKTLGRTCAALSHAEILTRI